MTDTPETAAELLAAVWRGMLAEALNEGRDSRDAILGFFDFHDLTELLQRLARADATLARVRFLADQRQYLSPSATQAKLSLLDDICAALPATQGEQT